MCGMERKTGSSPCLAQRGVVAMHGCAAHVLCMSRSICAALQICCKMQHACGDTGRRYVEEGGESWSRTWRRGHGVSGVCGIAFLLECARRGGCVCLSQGELRTRAPGLMLERPCTWARGPLGGCYIAIVALHCRQARRCAHIRHDTPPRRADRIGIGDWSRKLTI
jgi:hypothetical protein